MENKRDKLAEKEDKSVPLVEGLDFYFENGLMVLTRRYLMNRGFCCENQCRHCPYDDNGFHVLE